MQTPELQTHLGNLFKLIQEKETRLWLLNTIIKQPDITPEQLIELQEAKTNLIQTLKKARLNHAELWNSSYDL